MRTDGETIQFGRPSSAGPVRPAQFGRRRYPASIGLDRAAFFESLPMKSPSWVVVGEVAAAKARGPGAAGLAPLPVVRWPCALIA